jgi:hypothetical protein
MTPETVLEILGKSGQLLAVSKQPRGEIMLHLKLKADRLQFRKKLR